MIMVSSGLGYLLEEERIGLEDTKIIAEAQQGNFGAVLVGVCIYDILSCFKPCIFR